MTLVKDLANRVVGKMIAPARAEAMAAHFKTCGAFADAGPKQLPKLNKIGIDWLKAVHTAVKECCEAVELLASNHGIHTYIIMHACMQHACMYMHACMCHACACACHNAYSRAVRRRARQSTSTYACLREVAQGTRCVCLTMVLCTTWWLLPTPWLVSRF